MSRISKVPVIIVLALATVATTICCLKRNEVAHKEVKALGASETVAAAAPAANPIKADVTPVLAMEVYSNGTGAASWYPGTTEVEKGRALSFKVGGVVAELGIRNGLGLWHETVLARLDSREIQRNIRKLEAELAKSRLDVLKARAKYDAARKAYEQKTIKLDDLNTAVVSMQQAERTERKNHKQLQAAQRTYEQHELKMNEKGVINSVSITPGDKVAAGQTIAVFNPSYPVRVTAMLPAALITQVGPDGKARVRFTSLKGSFAARILQVGPETGGPASRFPVTMLVNRSSASLQSGAEAEANFRLEYNIKSTSFIVPADALGKDEKGTFVLVVKPADGNYGILEQRYVSAGVLAAYGQEITAGLADGEVVVIKSISRLRNGMKVRWK